MCKEAEINEKKTKHSLRATALSALAFLKMICEVTEHQSNALQLYERPSLTQKEAVSNILVQGKRSFSEEVAKLDDASLCSVFRLMQQTSVVDPTHQQWSGGALLGSLFSGLTNRTINTATHNFGINKNLPCPQEIDGLLC